MQKQHSRILLRALLRGRMWEMHREPRVPEAGLPVEECFDCIARITSKEFAPVHSVKNGILQCLFYKSENGCRFGEKCSYARRQVDEQPSKRSKKNVDKSAVSYVENYTTIGLRISGYGAAEVIIHFTEELKHTETNPMCKIHKSRRTSRWHSKPKSIAWYDLPR